MMETRGQGEPPALEHGRRRRSDTKPNIIPLVLVMLLAVLLLSAFVFHQFSVSQAEVEQIQQETELYSRKMRINSELMELARSRTRLTSAIIDTEDPFRQDDLNMELETHAARFARLRGQLRDLPLDSKEQRELDTHRGIISVILPAQRRAVELAQHQTDDSRVAAKALLYETVLPGQGDIINSFGRLIAHEQTRISALAATSRKQLGLMRERVRDALLTGLLAFAALTLTVAVRVYRIQIRLRRSREALEESNASLERRVAERTDELSRLNDTLRHASEHDQLTKIYNRRKFDEIIRQQRATALRTAQPYALALIDIDYFKPYNDHYGHQQGDRCLEAVAAALSSALARATDSVARYGGEEFAVVLPATDLDGAIRVAERLRRAVSDLRIEHAHSGVAGVVTISVGLAVCRPAESSGAHSCADVIEQADRQLYQAKSLGRDRVSYAEPERPSASRSG